MIFFLFFLGLLTGFVGTNTGGSAFVTVPTMIFLGIPAHSAIACARVASVGTMAAGLLQFHRHSLVDYRTALLASILGGLGALIGSFWMTQLDAPTIETVIGVFTLALYLLAQTRKKPDAANNPRPISRAKKIIGYSLFLFVGSIGGFFGGQAMLATYIFSFFFDMSLRESLGTRKVSGLVIALVSLLVYGTQGLIYWGMATSLFFGTTIGSSFGSAYAIKKGDKWLSRLFFIVILILSGRLIYRNF